MYICMCVCVSVVRYLSVVILLLEHLRVWCVNPSRAPLYREWNPVDGLRVSCPLLIQSSTSLFFFFLFSSELTHSKIRPGAPGQKPQRSGSSHLIMFSLSRLFLVSRKNLQLKCSSCTRLLPANYFPNAKGPKHLLVCASCKRLCVCCGVRLPLSDFNLVDEHRYSKPHTQRSRGAQEEQTDVCRRCSAKQIVAKENVYFRYPVLKYRACPYNVDEMRQELREEARKERGSFLKNRSRPKGPTIV
ncbi:hypothetical protein STCU_02757 [Strigomonas culicis]|uniref:Uncharacterized protein n=1 Tax=Strigomonas culicis TaxID=28005 RepID=S9UEL4_9TRYP|nr:hypothetical protein STCU_05903 [Strigomonas culicis]EPY32680.1 hypothetical protein STCU_02757 [Strigomonas culicis]|eukprot:EPY27134.1 hypothetical protein STCU_05903 [Strigomonas culicis]